uniref:Uncharacterized protein n=1 Tax=Ascaris lumbricoides TaxID=6252 RepID=A0A0M3IED0_ASCLU
MCENVGSTFVAHQRNVTPHLTMPHGCTANEIYSSAEEKKKSWREIA